ncbi:MAG TPA: hypothetical protein VGX91_10600 [Candidatus Cybelea sp.]|jgi:hypothetical protein|nr:hypothetical protein [Candidatus Cybelea sp.]
MLTKPVLALAAGFIIATAGMASARIVTNYPTQMGFQPNGKKAPTALAGVVSSSGTIAAGSGFSVSHDGTGEYTITVPAGEFKNCPSILATPAGYSGTPPVANDYDYIQCGSNGTVKMQIRILTTSGSLVDTPFHFLMTNT